MEQDQSKTETLAAVRSSDVLANSPTWPHVLAFAKRMEAKLAKNRHKGDREGWLKDHPWELVERMLDETVEVQQSFTAHSEGIDSPNPEKTADECADVANFCMMVADRVTYSANKKLTDAGPDAPDSRETQSRHSVQRPC